MNPRETRREFGARFLQRASGALLLPRADIFNSPEQQRFPFGPQECVLFNGDYYVLKREIGEPNLVRYKIPDFEAWFSTVGGHAAVDQEGVLSTIKEKPVPPAGWVEHWDGSFKERHKNGSTKIIPIMGLGSFSSDSKTMES